MILTLVFGLIGICSLKAQSTENKELKKQPAILTNWEGNILSLDYVQHNPKFDAGGTEDYFKNENKKIRTYKLSKNVKFYTCKSNYPTELDKIETVKKRFLKDKKKKQLTTYYFDINNGEIINIYQQCLP